MNPTIKPNYRPDVDGLRAIAILSVVIFHYFPTCLPGGFIGVDIFFVISGFLITGIISKEMESGSFSFLQFYKRRFLRIFPALITVFTVCLIFGWGSLFQSEFKNLGKHILGGLLFVSNLILKKEISYFDTAAELKPLLHLWSLAIEEQFYLIWPILLWYLKKKNKNILKIILQISLLFFIYNIIQSYTSPSKFFYSPFVRAWQLGIGAFVFYANQEKNKISLISLNLLSIAGIVLLFLGFVFLNDKLIYPGYWALIPTLGAAFVILTGTPCFFNKYVLSHRILVGIGLISYPLYLWHWPLLSLSKIVNAGNIALFLKACLLGASFILAFLTYKFIEKPIRFGPRADQKIRVLFVFVLLIGVTSFFAYKKYIPTYNKLDPDAYEQDWDYRKDANPIKFRERKFQQYESQNDDTVIFLGDSHIEQYAPRIKTLIKTYPEKTYSAIFATGGGCPLLPNMIDPKHHKHCMTLVEDTKDFIKNNPQIKKVCIGMASGYFSSNQYYYQNKNGQLYMNQGGAKKAQEDLVHLIKFYKTYLKKEVLLFLDSPSHEIFSPRQHLARYNFFLSFSSPNPVGVKPNNSSNNVFKTEVLSHQKIDRNILKNVAKQTGAKIIDPLNYLCSLDRCPFRHQESFMYKDSSHLASKFVKDHVYFVDPIIKKR